MPNQYYLQQELAQQGKLSITRAYNLQQVGLPSLACATLLHQCMSSQLLPAARQVCFVHQLRTHTNRMQQQLMLPHCAKGTIFWHFQN